jgi:hypothetical protein
MLTGGTPKADIRDINSRLIAMASSKGVDGREIKLCYVTVSPLADHLRERRIHVIVWLCQPEKIARNKQFLSMLEKLANAGKLGAAFQTRCRALSETDLFSRSQLV